jgi:hypothetical protein
MGGGLSGWSTTAATPTIKGAQVVDDGGPVGGVQIRDDVMAHVKDRRKQPEGAGEWELIKIPLRNLAYIPKTT